MVIKELGYYGYMRCWYAEFAFILCFSFFFLFYFILFILVSILAHLLICSISNLSVSSYCILPWRCCCCCCCCCCFFFFFLLSFSSSLLFSSLLFLSFPFFDNIFFSLNDHLALRQISLTLYDFFF
ncbi:hypothetical protein L228DRAFT_17047 [Xylona heveae TC161]|uniref:Uncharacterized protein n=1 Tax=Xylona heveae (strain CBS 132557 / TC161) TaxID=1328760 RepID=A0A165JWD2_XYLHT|nr:hypothetical protein L228DRAFT_17047 [Xylona heveae TC161]KZF26706.1 hypothetical protein L228DRAFT_17047 [Xylona heveae TC161]